MIVRPEFWYMTFWAGMMFSAFAFYNWQWERRPYEWTLGFAFSGAMLIGLALAARIR